MIIRVKKDKDNPYVQVNKQVLNDPKLSFKAKGLHAYMMSVPDDWKFFTSHLKTVSKDGQDSVDSAIKELINEGYITRQKAVLKKNKGLYAGYDYIVYEKK